MRFITWTNAVVLVCLLAGLAHLLPISNKTGTASGADLAIGTAYLALALLHFRYGGPISLAATALVCLVATVVAVLPLPLPAQQWAAYGALLGVVLLILFAVSRDALGKKRVPNA